LIADRGRTSAIYFSFNEDALRLAMQKPWVAVGMDAGSISPDSLGRWGERGHPRSFGTFPRILGKYVRQDSVISLEFAIRKMTSLPAQRYGFNDRGLLRPGMFARVGIVFERRAQALSSPRVALLDTDGTSNVFVVSNGKAEQRAIKTGLSNAGRIEVLEGLKGAEQVVVVGQNGLKDGNPVRVVSLEKTAQTAAKSGS
jgi:N-acyl-D-aspartate/D-glutamate deacylase